MGKVIFDISVSADGFMAAAGINEHEPLGAGGQRMHEWAAGGATERVPGSLANVGALLAGRRTYDTSLPWWGAGGPHPPIPVFVVTHAEPADPPADSLYTFVTGGLEDALARARRAPETSG